MTRSLIAVSLALLVASTGCIGLGSVSPAEVPSQDAQDQNWEKTHESSSSIAMGLGERVEKRYQPQDSPNRGAVSVVTANDVPLLDESQFLPQAIDRIEEENNIELEENRTRSLQLQNMDAAVTATEYDIVNAPVDGKAIVFTVPCDPFVAVVGFGTTPSDDGGLFGSGGTNYYEQAVTVAQHVTC